MTRKLKIGLYIVLGIITAIIAVNAFLSWGMDRFNWFVSSQSRPVSIPQAIDSSYENFKRANLQNYLEANLLKPSFNGKVFCYYEDLGKETARQLIKQYVWGLCEEYYLKNNLLKLGVGSSISARVDIKREANGFQILDSKSPRDGGYYVGDVENIFPEFIGQMISSRNSHPEYDLEGYLIQRAKIYYHIK